MFRTKDSSAHLALIFPNPIDPQKPLCKSASPWLALPLPHGAGLGRPGTPIASRTLDLAGPTSPDKSSEDIIGQETLQEVTFGQSESTTIRRDRRSLGQRCSYEATEPRPIPHSNGLPYHRSGSRLPEHNLLLSELHSSRV